MLKTINTITKTLSIDSNVTVLSYKDFILITGKKGRIVYKLDRRKNKTKLILKKNSLDLILEGDKENHNEKFFSEKITKLFNGVNNHHYVKLNLTGIGFRSWVYFDSNQNQILIVKIDLSKDLKFIIPRSVTVFCLTPTLIFIRGIQKDDVKSLALKIKQTRKVDNYKGKGIFFEGETKRLKAGKKI